MLNLLRRLLRRWLVEPRPGPVTSSEVGMKVVLIDKIIFGQPITKETVETRARFTTETLNEIGRIMGEAMVGHPYDECEKRGCNRLDATDN
ncbi:hypothetical protein LCGC14_2954690 [marine sediment metagenome]|uniref:Uncharacterized protein n=1 Tax=marine sediment metagenome TaxID=412755 RepID=A0A0F9A5E7_9ZZZZ